MIYLLIQYDLKLAFQVVVFLQTHNLKSLTNSSCKEPLTPISSESIKVYGCMCVREEGGLICCSIFLSAQ